MLQNKNEQGKIIYLDHAATTPICPEAYEAMLPFLREEYANPSGNYGFARKTREAVEEARAIIARSMGARPEEIFFTSGGTEADNWALKVGMQPGGHLITEMMEHHAVQRTAQNYALSGQKVTYLKPDENGLIHTEDLVEEITPKTCMVSIMYANNEIGTLQPISTIGKILKNYESILFHTDAVQAVGHIPIQVHASGIDLLSASGHKFGGPKGVGFLYLSGRCPKNDLLFGGGQEMGRRAGTENVAGIVGMGAALLVAQKNMAVVARRERALRDYMFHRIWQEIPDVYINGSMVRRLPGNVNVSFAGVEGAGLLVFLDAEGICASAGSACSAGEKGPSHVLLAIGRSEELARGAVRFTLGTDTRKEQIDFAVDRLKEAVLTLRRSR